jgi:hypothetical protein
LRRDFLGYPSLVSFTVKTAFLVVALFKTQIFLECNVLNSLQLNCFIVPLFFSFFSGKLGCTYQQLKIKFTDVYFTTPLNQKQGFAQLDCDIKKYLDEFRPQEGRLEDGKNHLPEFISFVRNSLVGSFPCSASTYLVAVAHQSNAVARAGQRVARTVVARFSGGKAGDRKSG